jgi:hypothetical protein
LAMCRRQGISNFREPKCQLSESLAAVVGQHIPSIWQRNAVRGLRPLDKRGQCWDGPTRKPP